MKVIKKTFANNTVEDIIEMLSNIRKLEHFDNYVFIIYRRLSYLGKSVCVDLYLSEDETELDTIIDFYNKELIDYYPCSAIFKNNIFLNGNNEYILFKRNCKNCIHNSIDKNNKEHTCTIFNCSPDLVTYICYNKETKSD